MLSKLFALLIWTITMGVGCILPINIIFCIVLKPSFTFGLKTIFVLLAMSIIVFGISIVLLFPVIKLADVLKQRYWLIFVLISGLLISVFVLYSKFLQTVKLTIKSVVHIGTTYYSTIESALENAVSGDLVFVDADTTGKVKITKDCEISLFNEYQIRNVSAKLLIKYSGSLKGYINLYAGSNVNTSKVDFIGNSGSFMMQLTDSTYSYLIVKYNPDTDVNDCDFYGGMTMNVMSLSVSGTTINTAGVYFPLNWCFDISLNKNPNQSTTAIYNLQQKLKMLPCSILSINEGTSATFDNLNVYTTFNDTSNIGAKYPNKEPAQLIVNGAITANKLGGNIYSTTAGASVTIKSSVSMTTRETDGAVSGSSFLASIGNQTVTNTATFYYGTTKLVATATGTYKFDGSKWLL